MNKINTLSERRKTNRIALTTIENFFRQCDVAASSNSEDLDITIIDISPNGMKISINCEEDQSKIKLHDEIFIRGCIFNNNIGFLSSQKAVTVWQDKSFRGIKFTPELEFDESSLREMLE